jgi:L-serine/L-threonine ammonia-lyase
METKLEASAKEHSSLDEPLHIETPLMKSGPLSEKTGCNIYLKLENTQPAGSYKVRGIGRLVQLSAKNGAKRFVSSSGGNAGVAAAYAAKAIGYPCTVVVPTTTAQFMQDKIKRDATNLEIFGQAFDDAHGKAVQMLGEPGTVLIHPFDHPEIWEGHSTIMDEIEKQLPKNSKPDAVILSVGGGGLLSGCLLGMHKRGWNDVPVITMETYGTESFYKCVTTGQWAQLDEIRSICKTLGAKKVCKRAFDWISEHKQIHSSLVTDKQAVEACISFADDHRFLVSPSCGAALAALYGDFFTQLRTSGKLPAGKLNVVVIVCGGNEINLEQLDKWKVEFQISQ